MKINLSSKTAQWAFLLVCLGFAILLAFGFVDFIQTQNTRTVFSAIGRANDERKKGRENLASAERYIVALRSINVDNTKKELKPAFISYVSGLEEGLALFKAGKNTASADAKSEAAHKELVEIAKRYE